MGNGVFKISGRSSFLTDANCANCKLKLLHTLFSLLLAVSAVALVFIAGKYYTEVA